MVDVIFEIPELAEFSMAEIYREYKTNRICVNNAVRPYVFSDLLKREHKPIIIYESDDYLYNYINSSIYDKLQIKNNYIKYSYCEMYEEELLLLNGSLLLGSIYSILIMLKNVLKTHNKIGKLFLDLRTKSNIKVMLKMQKELMCIEEDILGKYRLEKDKEHSIDYTMSNIDDNEINKFTNRFLELFVSENPRSNNPFMLVKVPETSKFLSFLQKADEYLMLY
jgi:hypothetical protein